MENKLGAVEKAAMKKNGWHVIAIYKNRHMDGTVPHGTVAFVREPSAFEPHLRCGTAEWAINEATGVYFHGGHYDLDRSTAMADFADRTNRMVIR